MTLTTKIAALADVDADWLIVGAWENEGHAGAGDLDGRLGGLLTRLRERGDLSGKARELTVVHHNQLVRPERLLIVGLGPRRKIDFAGLAAAAATAARSVTGKPLRRLAFALPPDVPGLDLDHVVRAVGVALRHGSEGPGLCKNQRDRFVPEQICLVAPPGTPNAALEAAAQRANIEAQAVSLARARQPAAERAVSGDICATCRRRGGGGRAGAASARP